MNLSNASTYTTEADELDGPVNPLAANLRLLWRYRELLYSWTRRDIQVRYKQSVLGAAWAFLQPLSLMAAFSLIFTLVIEMPTDGVPYPLFSYCALLPWTFFSTAISFGAASLTNNMNLVTKVYFPREILPLGSIGAAFVDFLVASTIFAGLMVIYRQPVSWTVIWVPVLLAIQIMLMTGVILLTSALMVFYRDFRFVVPLGVQLWMYASPIIYPMNLIPEKLMPVYLLNPMAGLIDAYRRVLLFGQNPDPYALGVSLVISLALFIFGYLYFKKSEWQFADLI